MWFGQHSKNTMNISERMCDYMSVQDSINISELSREDFGSLCICAVRYCLGRKTYMPSNIQRIISSTLAHLSDSDLEIIYRDIKKHGGPTHDSAAYGDYTDYLDWHNFLCTIKDELANRCAN